MKSFELLPDEEPGPDDILQRAVIQAALQMMQEQKLRSNQYDEHVKLYRWVKYHEFMHTVFGNYSRSK